MATTGPTFLGIGAQKAGTTWLHRMLSLHPDIGMPEQKELHFWDREIPNEAGIAAYLARFAYLRGRAHGEITPSYAILPPERISLIRRILPELCFIYVLRNPIERAWSQARMELARELRHGLDQAESSWTGWLMAQLGSAASLARGNYASCLYNWFAHYGRERFLIGVHEENLGAPREFLASCARHLGVTPSFYETLSAAELNTPVLPEVEILKVTPVALPAKPPRIFADTLLKTYTPLVREIETLLGRPLAHLWLAPYQIPP